MKNIAVIAGPSGSGKNTLIKTVKSRFPNVESLTTVTTRTPRPGEVDGVDYFFYTIEQFDRESALGNIVGTRFVPLFGGVHYGIYLPDLKKKIEHATTVLAPVDISGARWLKEQYGALTIFLMPETYETYKARIHARSPDMSPREFEMRMKIAQDEIRIHAAQYDYRVITSDGGLMDSVEQVLEILQKEGYTL